MSTIIFPSPIFGPIHSRRLGVSLGINLLPADGKVCTFDCLYCECGFNASRKGKSPLPTKEEVLIALEKELQKMQKDNIAPNVLTFAGNGEPTIHPKFHEIIDETIKLRDKYFPDAKVSVLSNSTLITRPTVFNALKKVDNNILKLDTVDPKYIDTIDRPMGNYDLKAIVDKMKEFDGRIIIQTMFMKGNVNGYNVDNTGDEYVIPWIELLKDISPSEVMIYTIDRETPQKGLEKATHEELDRIVARLRDNGFKATASY